MHAQTLPVQLPLQGRQDLNSQQKSQPTLHTNNNLEDIFFPSFSKLHFMFNPVQIQNVIVDKKQSWNLIKNFIHSKAHSQACGTSEWPTASYSLARRPKSSQTEDKRSYSHSLKAVTAFCSPQWQAKINPDGGH